MKNGADLSYGDVGNFSCMAAEQNSLDLLQEIVKYGGDVTLPRGDGSTALHQAVCEGSTEAVKFLLDRGADPAKQDANGWTPRDFADQQSHEEIKTMFEEKNVKEKQPAVTVQEQTVRFAGLFRSEPSIRLAGNDFMEDSVRRNQRRRKTNNFHNSIFGIMSVAQQDGEKRSSISEVEMRPRIRPIRVTISCPQVTDSVEKLVLLPGSIQELIELGGKKFGVVVDRVVTDEGAEIDDVGLVRDGDRLVLERSKE